MSKSESKKQFCWICQATSFDVHEIVYINMVNGKEFQIGACESCIQKIDDNPDLRFEEPTITADDPWMLAYMREIINETIKRR